ncbi:MAG TPA: hypothetical protein VG893_16145 [Terracidiphilus sp.]|nr:hypothetical protein [Terracidiphilus sp.]
MLLHLLPWKDLWPGRSREHREYVAALARFLDLFSTMRLLEEGMRAEVWGRRLFLLTFFIVLFVQKYSAKSGLTILG